MSKDKEYLHIYTRVSTTSQKDDGTSLDNQRKLGEKKAKSLGMIPILHNEESASSSFDNFDNRPVLFQLLRKIEDGEVKNLYVYNSDRLSRNTITWGIIRQKLKGKTILYTETGKVDLDNKTEDFMFGILSEVSVYENNLRKERLYEGRRIKARQGFWYGGPTPFGYKTNKNKKLILDKNEHPWVVKMFEWYSEGLSPKKIKHKLDGNIPTRRGNLLWSYGSVESVLTNTHHNGYYVCYGEHIKCPRGVDEILYEKVQKRRKRTVRTTLNGDNKWKDESTNIRNLLVCGHCNNEMGGRTRQYKDKEKRVYQCVRHNKKWKEVSNNEPWKRQKYCSNNVSIDSNRIEDGVWETLLGIMKESYQIKEEFKEKQLSNRKKSNRQRDKDLKELLIKKEKIKDKIKDVEETIIKLDIERVGSREKESMIVKKIDLLQIKHDEFTTQLNDIEIEITSLKNKDLWVDWVNDYDRFINESIGSPRKEKIELMRKYIKNIKVLFDPETRLHQMDLELRLNLINDSLNYIDPKKKKKGYELKEGHNKLKVDMDYNVRNLRI